ncbi:transposase [Clostridium sp.]
MRERKKFDKSFKEQTVAKILSGETTTSLMSKELGIHRK